MWKVLQRRIAIKKAMKWDTKKVRRKTTTFLPPTPNVAQPSSMEPNFWKFFSPFMFFFSYFPKGSFFINVLLFPIFQKESFSINVLLFPISQKDTFFIHFLLFPIFQQELFLCQCFSFSYFPIGNSNVFELLG